MGRLQQLFSELKRRRVFRALLGWGIASFAVLQVIEPLMHGLGLPEWTLKAAIWSLAAGFPITVVLAWFFDLGPRGVTRTPDAPLDVSGAGNPPRRVALLGLLFAVLLLGAGLAIVTLRTVDRPAALAKDGRITVAVADFQNQTGERQLDQLSGLLITSLQQARSLHVLTRTRMLDLARAGSAVQPDRIDEKVGRDVGRAAGARALLLATAHRLGNRYAIELRAMDPARDEYLFTLKEEAPSQEAIFALMDRLGDRAVVALGGPQQADGFRVGEMTSSLDAWSHYAQGLQLIDRLRFDEGQAEFRKALKLDPAFALAHLALAGEGRAPIERDAQAAHLRAALDGAARLPARERLRIRGEDALFRGDLDEASARYRDLLVLAPEDWRAELRFAQIEFVGRNASEAALPHAERSVALAPGRFPAQDMLAFILIDLGRLDEAAVRARGWADRWPSSEVLALVNHLDIRRGDGTAALASARRAVEMDGGVDRLGLIARTSLLLRDFRGWEESLRLAWRRGEGLPLGVPALYHCLVNRGKLREASALALEVGKANRPEMAARLGLLEALRSDDEQRIQDSLERARPLVHPVSLALMLQPTGRSGDAAELLRAPAVESYAYSGLRPAHGFQRVVEATRTSSSHEALRRSLEEVARSPHRFVESILGRQALARACFDAGDFACAAEAMSEIDRWATIIGTFTPDAFYLLAVSHERLGRRDEAQRHLADLEKLLDDADSDYPMLPRMRALRARLASAAPPAR